MGKFIETIEVADVDLMAVSKEELHEAMTDIIESIGLSETPFPFEGSKEEQAEWCVEAAGLIEETDQLEDSTYAVLTAIGFGVPEIDNTSEDENEGQETEQEATAEPEEAEKHKEKPAKKPVKEAKAEKGTRKKLTDEEKAARKAEKDAAKEKKKAEKKPGVIATLHEYVLENMTKGFTVNKAHDHIVAAFPEKNPTSLLATCRVQLQNSRMGRERGLAFTRTKDGEEMIITARFLKEGEEPPKAEKKVKEPKPAKAEKPVKESAPIKEAKDEKPEKAEKAAKSAKKTEKK